MQQSREWVKSNVVRRIIHTLEALVTIMLIHKDIICKVTEAMIRTHSCRFLRSEGRGDRGALFWVSLGCWYCCGAKLKLVIWELCGSSRRAVESPDIMADRCARVVVVVVVVVLSMGTNCCLKGHEVNRKCCYSLSYGRGVTGGGGGAETRSVVEEALASKA